MNILSRIYKRQSKRKVKRDYFALFIQSREVMGVSPRTLRYYRERLSKFFNAVDYIQATRQDAQKYLNSIPPNQNGFGTRHASYRAIKAFYRWLNSEYGITNITEKIPAPILTKPILPTLEKEQVFYLIEKARSSRDKAIIALFTESGLRLSELVNIKPKNINWKNRTIRVMCKGRKEGLAAFGELTERYLKNWFKQYKPNGNIWGLNQWGITSMLRKLEADTKLPCNPHVFRRTFACLLRKAGVDTMTIRDLGRWESIEMVERYTRSMNFDDCLKLYEPPLS